MFAEIVVRVYIERYPRAPNIEDTAMLLAMHEAKGWPGILGSVDCMHSRWKNCVVAWHDQITGHCHDPTIIFEVVTCETCGIGIATLGCLNLTMTSMYCRDLICLQS